MIDDEISLNDNTNRINNHLSSWMTESLDTMSLCGGYSWWISSLLREMIRISLNSSRARNSRMQMMSSETRMMANSIACSF